METESTLPDSPRHARVLHVLTCKDCPGLLIIGGKHICGRRGIVLRERGKLVPESCSVEWNKQVRTKKDNPTLICSWCGRRRKKSGMIFIHGLDDGRYYCRKQCLKEYFMTITTP